MIRTPLCSGLASVAILVVAAGPVPNAATADVQLPPDFELTTLASDLDQPVALEASADGRIFVAERLGTIRVIENDALLPDPFVELDEVYTVGENGLLGLALDPNFADNGYVYGLAAVSHQRQQIIRWRDVDGIGVEPVVIRDNLPAGPTNHSGGGLEFAPDGRLYFSIGDTGVPELAQDLNSLAGKVCRIESDGSTPADNPLETITGAPRAVYALGFRNPFRMCFDADGRLFVLDVGSNGDEQREEINLVRPGDNGGWPDVEGGAERDAFPEYLFPIWDYHADGAAITGAAIYLGDRFPAEYHGNLFHLEFVQNQLYRLALDGEQVLSHEPFADLEGGPTDLIEAPDGSLLISEMFTGRIRRLAYTGPPPNVPVESEPAGADGDRSGGDGGMVAGDTADASDAAAADPDADPGPGLAPLCGFGALPFLLLGGAGVLGRRGAAAPAKR